MGIELVYVSLNKGICLIYKLVFATHWSCLIKKLTLLSVCLTACVFMKKKIKLSI